MKLYTGTPNAIVTLEEVFNPIKLRSTTGEELFVSMRDGGFEIRYAGTIYCIKEGKMFKMESSNPTSPNAADIPTANTQAPPVKLPETLEEAVEYFFPHFDGMDKSFNKYDEEGFASFCHSMLSGGISMQIRNHLSLWGQDGVQDTPIRTYFLKLGIKQPDSMSAEIVKGVYRKFHAIKSTGKDATK